MAGARTQGVGRGVNWGAFGSMGQQYAQIGRTIESGGEALGKGIGGGLAAIGGAIERKKVRDREAEERQKERTYRADRDKIMDARYDESNREQNQLFEHNLFQEAMQSEYLQGRGFKAEMEQAAAKKQNLGALIESHLKVYQETGDPKSLEIVRRAAEAQATGLGVEIPVGAQIPEGFTLPGLSAGGPAVAGAGGMDPEEIAKSNLVRDMGTGILENPGVNPSEIGIGGIQGRLLSEARLARDKELIEQNMERLRNMGRPKGFLEMRIREREMHLLGTAYAEVKGREKALGLAKERSKGMATQEAERRKADEARTLKLESDKNRVLGELKAYRALTGKDAPVEIAEAILAGGLSGEAAAANTLKKEEDARKEAEGKGPKAGDGPKPITRADMQQTAADIIAFDRPITDGDGVPVKPDSPLYAKYDRARSEALWAKGERSIAAVIASGEWTAGDVTPKAAKLLKERLGGDGKRAVALVMAEIPRDQQTPEKLLEVMALFGVPAPASQK